MQELAELLELKLRANEHKQLEGVSSHYLYMKLMEAMQELFGANLSVHENNWYVPNEETEALCRAVAFKAADVAAVAGFFAARIKVLTDPSERSRK